jgi:DNA adenine methylase
MSIETRAKPFVKWAGGKQSLANTLVGYFPRSYIRHFEPFLGGGSVLLAASPKIAVASDLNDWLLDAYSAVRSDWRQVAAVLDTLPNSREDFLRIRAIDPAKLGLYERAAIFIYLNKTCFRGLFRVNQKGEFNVPYGQYQRAYYDPVNLARVAAALKHVELRAGDFEETIHDVRPEDFVYFDPPYYKAGGYSDFNRYTKGQFRESDHLRLAALCKKLDDRGIKWALSNSNTEFVRELYSDFSIHEIRNRREINLQSRQRTVIELVVTNYPVSKGQLSLFLD